MFKKFFAILLALALTLSFAACAQKPNNAATGNDNGSTTESEPDKIEADEKLLTVDITLPASMFEDQDMAAFDADAYTKEQGFLSTKVNEDGSVSVTMTKSKHNELLTEMATSLDSTFAEFVNAEDTAYIKEITHNDDFTAVTMKVDKAAYENALDFTPFVIGVSVAMYQAFVETEYHVDITIVDAASGDTIKTISYPDAMNG